MSFCVHSTGAHKADVDDVVVVVLVSIFKYISLRWDLGSQKHRPVNGTPCLLTKKPPTFFFFFF